MSKVRIYKVPTALEEAARYASAAGVTLKTWQEMGEKERKAHKDEIDAREKAEAKVARENERQRAAVMLNSEIILRSPVRPLVWHT